MVPLDTTHQDGPETCGCERRRSLCIGPSRPCDCLLSGSSSEKANGDTWRITVQSVRPQWAGRIPGAAPDAGNNDFAPIICAAGDQNASRRYSVSSVYPGQQKCVSIQGFADRVHDTVENITFYDADLRYSHSTGRWLIQWNRRQVATTPSGIVIVPFNRRIMDDMTQADSDTEWTATRACELDLGMKSPTSSSVSSSTTVVAASPMLTEFSVSPHDGWRTLWVPGTQPPVRHVNRRTLMDSPVFPYFHDGFSPMSLALVGSNQIGAAPLPGGIPDCSLPSHMAELHLVVRTSVVVERQSFTIVAPVTHRLH